MIIDHMDCLLSIVLKQHTGLHMVTLPCPEHLVPTSWKHRQGGQSAQRFERLIEEAAHNFFKRATEHACSYWLPNLENIQAIFIGGPGATKDYVVRNEYSIMKSLKNCKSILMLVILMKLVFEISSARQET